MESEVKNFQFSTFNFQLNRGSSSVDRALAFQAEGRGFESRLPLSKKSRLSEFRQPAFL